MASDASIRARWSVKLAIRRTLLASARRALKRAPGSKAARTKVKLREAQVDDALSVLARHKSLPNVRTVDANGIALIAGFEGFRANVYHDAVGVATQGYGETQGITPGRPWTQAYALARLKSRVNRDYAPPVAAACKRATFRPTQHEFNAMVSLCYNVGGDVFDSDHTMGNAIASRNVERIANAFLVYDIAGGRVLPGLSTRRHTERALFLTK